MPYESELRFLRSAYQKIRLKTQVFSANSIPNESVDLGLRRQLGIKRETGWALFDFVSRMRHNTICRLTDDFFCSYCFLLLPDRAEKTVFTLGPYLTEEPSRERILERARPWDSILQQCQDCTAITRSFRYLRKRRASSRCWRPSGSASGGTARPSERWM